MRRDLEELRGGPQEGSRVGAGGESLTLALLAASLRVAACQATGVRRRTFRGGRCRLHGGKNFLKVSAASSGAVSAEELPALGAHEPQLTWSPPLPTWLFSTRSPAKPSPSYLGLVETARGLLQRWPQKCPLSRPCEMVGSPSWQGPLGHCSRNSPKEDPPRPTAGACL